MADIVLRLEIPIPVDKVVGAPALTFTKWLPIGDDQAIVTGEDNLELKLWFDIRSTWWASHIPVEELSQHINVLAHRVYADINIKSVRVELIEYMRNRDYSNPTRPEDRHLQDEYDELAWRALSLALNTLNRLLSYVKSRWGQYWLLEYEFDRGVMYSYYGQFKGKASVDRSQWFRFSPSSIQSLTCEWIPETRYIRCEDWDEVRAYMLSAKKPPLARSLLASAESLAANGHSRSALTEAVTALEVALHEFARNQNADVILAPKLRDRLGLQTLKTQIDRIGLTASISYLLPILLPESLLSQSVLDGCREAISQRQNVIHQGQREVCEDILKSCLKAVRQMCELLESVTTDPEILGRETKT